VTWWGVISIFPSDWQAVLALNWLASFVLYSVCSWILIFIFYAVFVAPYWAWKSEREARIQAEFAIDTRKKVLRDRVINALRNEYIQTHDNISPRIVAGTELPPLEWLNRRLIESGQEPLG